MPFLIFISIINSSPILSKKISKDRLVYPGGNMDVLDVTIMIKHSK
jgi:hypothetical protein